MTPIEHLIERLWKRKRHVAPGANPMPTITIENDTAVAVSPEGKTARLGLKDLFARLLPPRADTGGICLPAGTHLAYSRGRHTILVSAIAPRKWQLKWLTSDSPAPFGSRAKYRNVTIALPYLVILAVFEDHLVTDASECFFRTAPLESEEDELLFPALLNCSKFTPPEGRPLSWICTQKLDRSAFLEEKDSNRKLRAGMRALCHCLLETGFNRSSEMHEGSSWFQESTRVDPRVATVEAWEAASETDTLFVLDVPWLKTGLTVRQVVDRIFTNVGAPRGPAVSVKGLMRLIFNHGTC